MGRTSGLQLRADSGKVDLRRRQTVVSLPEKLFAVSPLRKHGVQWLAPAQQPFVAVGPRECAGLEICLRSRVNSDDVDAPGRSFRRGALEGPRR